jgi:hypothetical protein
MDAHEQHKKLDMRYNTPTHIYIYIYIHINIQDTGDMRKKR